MRRNTNNLSERAQAAGLISAVLATAGTAGMPMLVPSATVKRQTRSHTKSSGAGKGVGDG